MTRLTTAVTIAPSPAAASTVVLVAAVVGRPKM
jgi:hypothetical protein